MHKYLALLFVVSLFGCSNHQMYQGDRLTRDNYALLYIQEYRAFRFKEIDGKKVNFVHDGKVLEFEPGPHTFVVEIGGNLRNKPGGLYKFFRLNVNLKPGYTYTHNFKKGLLFAMPEVLCLMGEPHDAPGSSVNLTKEFRTMSDNATAYGCTKAFKTIRTDY